MGAAARGSAGVQRVWRVSGVFRSAGPSRVVARCADRVRAQRDWMDDVGLLGIVWRGHEERWEDGGGCWSAKGAGDEVSLRGDYHCGEGVRNRESFRAFVPRRPGLP